MSIPAMLWAANYQDLPLDKRTRKPSPSCAAVLNCLAWHASEDGTDSFPSVARIVWFTKWSERNVQLALQALEVHGTIRKTPDPLRRSQVIPDPRHQPTSWDLVPMLRGANSDDPGPQGCKVEDFRGAKSSDEDRPEFAPERSYNLTPTSKTKEQERKEDLSSPATPDGVSDTEPDEDLGLDVGDDDQALIREPVCLSKARGSRKTPLGQETRGTQAARDGVVGTQGSAQDDLGVREDVEQLCRHLRDRIIGNGSKAPTITKAWRTAARLLLDSDAGGRPLAKALKLVDWCQDDVFWQSRIMSMPKFRDQYDKLRMQANDEYKARNGQGPAGDRSRSGHQMWRQPEDDSGYDKDPFMAAAVEQEQRLRGVGA